MSTVLQQNAVLKYTQYIINPDINIYIITSQGKASSRCQYFLGKYEAVVSITSSTLPGHLTLTNDFLTL